VSSFAIALVVLGCSFGASLVGMALHVKLPDHHLGPESRAAVNHVMGLIASVSALVLGLLVSSEYTAYDRQNDEIKAISANLILLDRTLGLYGPDAKMARDGLRENVRQSLDRIWSPEGARPENLNSTEIQNAIKSNIAEIESLSPKTDIERLMQNRALQESETLSQARLLMFEQLGSSIPWPFLTVLTFWIAMLFLGFGLLSRFNGTVLAALLLGAISVAGALFLIQRLVLATNRRALSL
jgi:hypothetical protein